MGILKDQAIRLRREQPWTADLLAEELFAILNSDRPILIDSPVEINSDDFELPALTVNNRSPNDDTPGVRINREGDKIDIDGDTINLGDLGDIIPTENIETEVTGGGGIPGQVVSGTGGTYQVRLYEEGIAAGSTRTVSVTVPGILDTETIPADTWLAVMEINNTFVSVVPLWLP